MFINPNPKRGSIPTSTLIASMWRERRWGRTIWARALIRACFNPILIDYESPVLYQKSLSTLICFASSFISCIFLGCGLLCHLCYYPSGTIYSSFTWPSRSNMLSRTAFKPCFAPRVPAVIYRRALSCKISCLIDFWTSWETLFQTRVPKTLIHPTGSLF